MGGSEQGPAKPFWRSFFLSPGQERPEAECLDFFRRLLKAAYGESSRRVSNLHEAGFRILPCDGDLPFDCWSEEPLPSWVSQYVLRPRESIDEVRYLLTFRPFLNLPAKVRRAYLAGACTYSPFPAAWCFGACKECKSCRVNSRWRCRYPCCTRSNATRRRTAYACRNRDGCTNLTPSCPSTTRIAVR